MAISSESLQKLLPLLRPLMQVESQRRGYLMRSLGMNTPVLNCLVFNQAADTFITDMLQQLVAFGEIIEGKPAVCALLEVIREDVGEDVQLRIDRLLQQIREELKKPQPPPITWKYLHPLNGHSAEVESVAISPNGEILSSGSRDTTIKLWNLSTGALLHSFKGNSIVVKHVAFSPDGQTLASIGNFETADGNIKLWDVSTGRLKGTLGQGLSNFGIFCIAISPDGKTLVIGHVSTIKLWDLHTGEELNTLWAGYALQVNSLAFSSDGQFLVAGCSQGDIKIWDWRNQNLLRTLYQTSDFIGFVTSFFNKVLWCLAISPDGQMIASGGENLPLALWNFDSGTILRTLPSHSGRVHSLAFSPDGLLLASGGEDKTIRIWNTHTGDLLYTFQRRGTINSLAFSPDGKTLVSGGDDKTIEVWGVSC